MQIGRRFGLTGIATVKKEKKKFKTQEYYEFSWSNHLFTAFSILLKVQFLLLTVLNITFAVVQVLTSVKQQPPSPRRRVWHEYTIRAEWYFVISSITGLSRPEIRRRTGGKRDTWTVSPRFGLSNWLGESVQLGREKPVIIIERNKEWTRSKTWRNVEFTAAKLSS